MLKGGREGDGGGVRAGGDEGEREEGWGRRGTFSALMTRNNPSSL